MHTQILFFKCVIVPIVNFSHREYFVSLFYCNGIYNNTDEECVPQPLSVDACNNPTLCSLDEFIELVIYVKCCLSATIKYAH